MTLRRCLTIRLAMLLLTTAATAQPDVIATRFQQLDTDGDGKLSPE
jgi:hypothetical protein